MPRYVNLANLQQFTAVDLRFDAGAIGGPIVIPQCVEIVLAWALTDAKVAHNVLHGSYVGAFNGSVAQANAIMSALTTGAAWTALATHLATGTLLGGVSLRNLNVANQPLIQSNATGVAGTSTGTALPDETALVVTFRTGNTGRANRGRYYQPGFASTAIGAGGVVAAAAVTALGNWATNNLLASISAQSYVPVVAQKARQAYTGTTGTPHPARPAGTVAITGAVVRDNHWDSQRRRGLK